MFLPICVILGAFVFINITLLIAYISDKKSEKN